LIYQGWDRGKHAKRKKLVVPVLPKKPRHGASINKEQSKERRPQQERRHLFFSNGETRLEGEKKARNAHQIRVSFDLGRGKKRTAIEQDKQHAPLKKQKISISEKKGGGRGHKDAQK